MTRVFHILICTLFKPYLGNAFIRLNLLEHNGNSLVFPWKFESSMTVVSSHAFYTVICVDLEELCTSTCTHYISNGWNFKGKAERPTEKEIPDSRTLLKLFRSCRCTKTRLNLGTIIFPVLLALNWVIVIFFLYFSSCCSPQPFKIS